MKQQILDTSEPLCKVNSDKRFVSLTFDDGPHPEHTPKLLDALAVGGMHATFFVKACFVREYPDLACAVVRHGHELANHSTTHPNLDTLESIDDIRQEIAGAQEIIKKYTGIEPVLFRAPCGRHDDRVWQVLREFELPSVLLSIDTHDWDAENSSRESVFEKAVAGIGSGDIVLMHELHAHTPQALPDIIRVLQEQGLKSVTVSELMSSAKH